MWFPSVEKNLCGPALWLSEAKKEWALKDSQANVSGEMEKKWTRAFTHPIYNDIQKITPEC